MSTEFDVIIVGGGILGASTAMQLQQQYPDARIALIEKASELAQHQTGRNSGVIHAGVYYTPGSLKADFCRRGNVETKAFCDEHGIPYRECGKLIVATNELEQQRLETLWQRTADNGIERYRLDADELAKQEPHVSGLAAIHVPTSAIVDYAQVTRAMVQQFVAKGGIVKLETELLSVSETDSHIHLKTGKGELKAQFMVSCAGLWSDRVVRMLGHTPDFTICPFRGEYYQLPQAQQNLVNHMIYPVPDPAVPFLGVHLTPMINGALTVGPNAVLALRRDGCHKTDISLRDTLQIIGHKGIRRVLKSHWRFGLGEWRNSLCKRVYLKEVQKYCPGIALDWLKPYPAGVRAQAVSNEGKLVDDFLFFNTGRTVNVCNAPSPAATSAIPIGEHIGKQLQALVS